jgi:hypothetical protein
MSLVGLTVVRPIRRRESSASAIAPEHLMRCSGRSVQSTARFPRWDLLLANEARNQVPLSSVMESNSLTHRRVADRAVPISMLLKLSH